MKRPLYRADRGRTTCLREASWLTRWVLALVLFGAAEAAAQAQESPVLLLAAIGGIAGSVEQWTARVAEAPCPARRDEAAFLTGADGASGLASLTAAHQILRDRLAAYLNEPTGPVRTAAISHLYRLWLQDQSLGMRAERRQYDVRLPAEIALAYSELADALLAKGSGAADTTLRAFWRWSGRFRPGENERFTALETELAAAFDRLLRAADRVGTLAAGSCE